MDTKALRQKILDLAIRGKLVPQDPNDEPASVLLERIRAEKQQMLKDGKLKAKDLKNDTVIFKSDDNLHYEKFPDGSVKCIENEIPFELPDGWEWTKLGIIFNHNTGKALNSSNQVGELYTYITTSNVYWEHFELENLKQMRFTADELDKCTVTKGDLLVCEGGDIGRSAIWESDNDIRIQNHIHRLRAFVDVSVKFYYYVLYFYKTTGRINGNGIGMQGLSSNKLHSLYVPLPPVAEQKRIVDTINKYFEIIQTLETDTADIKGTITSAKSKILDLAIRGKLVPQDPNDEPASVLLERIRAEKEELIRQGKIKRDKRDSVIFRDDDNSYHKNIPQNWEVCSLLEIAEVELGKMLDKAKNTGNYYPYLRSVNVKWDNIDLTDIKEMRFEKDELERYLIRKNDLLICEGGDVGRCCIWDSEQPIYYQNALHRVRFYGGCLPRYFLYFIMFLEDTGYLKKVSNGVTIKHLTKVVLSNIPFLIPPLAEQYRIVKAIEQYFSYLDTISESIS